MQQTSEQMKTNKLTFKGGFYMFNKFKHIKNEKGLTLIELLAVIVILAIIAVIAIPAIGNIINTSRDKAQVSDALNIIAGGKLAHVESGCGTSDGGCTGTELAGFIDGKDAKSIVVKLGSDKNWTIANYTFEFKTDKFKDKNIGASPTESKLTEALGEEKKPNTP